MHSQDEALIEILRVSSNVLEIVYVDSDGFAVHRRIIRFADFIRNVDSNGNTESLDFDDSFSLPYRKLKQIVNLQFEWFYTDNLKEKLKEFTE